MALKMYGKYNNAEERANDAPARKAMRAQKALGSRETRRRSTSDGSMPAPNKLLNAHLEEIHNKGADAYNIGAYTDASTIGSKTDKGYLSSSQNKAGAVSHAWEEGSLANPSTMSADQIGNA